MAAKLDFRKTLRAIATSIQEANQARLLAGQAIRGGALAPRAQPHEATKSNKRIRIKGERVKLRDLAGTVGVASGALLRDLVRAGNVKLGRTSFKIRPSPDVALRMFAFVKGAASRVRSSAKAPALAQAHEEHASVHQPPRPFSGIPGEILDHAAAQLASDGCEQLTAGMQADLEASRSEEVA